MKPVWKNRIFSFWEPPGTMTPYLRLCRKTWERNLHGYELVDLDYSTLDPWIHGALGDLAALGRFRLPIQKDAIMVALLERNGGTFFDADTLVLGDITPLLTELDTSEVVMFGTHLSVVASRPQSSLFTLWLEQVRERFIRSGNGLDVEIADQWDYLGNAVLTQLMDDRIRRSLGLDRVRGRVVRRTIDRVSAPFLRRARGTLIRNFHRRTLTMLDRHDYIPEAVHFRGAKLNAIEQYRRFWFEEEIDVDEVFARKPIVIGLHHTWTPDWYKELSETEVVSHPCLLSRTLSRLLAGSQAISTGNR